MTVELINDTEILGLHETFPEEVEFVLSAMEAGPRPLTERQKQPRIRHRVHASLRLFSDGDAAAPHALYTRHVNASAAGFLAATRLPVSHGGVIELVDLAGRPAKVYCTVLRCREAAPGWFEGAVYFNREQPGFGQKR